MDKTTLGFFLALVFGAVFLLSQILIVPAFGTSQQEMRRMRKRLAATMATEGQDSAEGAILLLRERFRHAPSRLEQALSGIPGIRSLIPSPQTAGHAVPSLKYLFAALLLALVGGLVCWSLTGNYWLTTGAALGAGWLPFLKLKTDQAKRFAMFEEQLPGALEAMIRALRAGYPFSETLRQVAKEMDDPVATEFRIAFDEINAGVDIRKALRNMLLRTPSMTLMALITMVSVQRETGGNLAESLTNISGVIRGRFQFQRRVRTLTAEGRMSAWILALMPFVLFAMISFMMPELIRGFVADPKGQQMMLVGMGLMVVGIVWLRKLLNIEI